MYCNLKYENLFVTQKYITLEPIYAWKLAEMSSKVEASWY